MGKMPYERNGCIRDWIIISKDWSLHPPISFFFVFFLIFCFRFVWFVDLCFLVGSRSGRWRISRWDRFVQFLYINEQYRGASIKMPVQKCNPNNDDNSINRVEITAPPSAPQQTMNAAQSTPELRKVLHLYPKNHKNWNQPKATQNRLKKFP